MYVKENMMFHTTFTNSSYQNIISMPAEEEPKNLKKIPKCPLIEVDIFFLF